jgi:hypothetical protein
LGYMSNSDRKANQNVTMVNVDPLSEGSASACWMFLVATKPIPKFSEILSPYKNQDKEVQQTAPHKTAEEPANVKDPAAGLELKETNEPKAISIAEVLRAVHRASVPYTGVSLAYQGKNRMSPSSMQNG